jgi:hypothetical protein
MKVRDTVTNLLNHHPQVAQRYENGDVLLAAARELGDAVSFRLIRATEDLGNADPDNEAGYQVRVDELAEAERAFLLEHADTEVEL